MTRYRYTILPGGRRVATREDNDYPVLPFIDGTAEDILKDVGSSSAAAQLYLDAERKRDKPRSTLVAKLERIAG